MIVSFNASGDAPAVSIVVAAYNAETTLAETIESVLALTRSGWELVVVDDGSTDNTLALARDHAARDRRIRVISKANGGTASARNAGFSASRAGWMLFLDADDMIGANYLERMEAFIAENPGFDIYSCNAAVLLRDGSTQLMWSGRPWRGARSVSIADQIAESSISPVTLFRRSVWERTGGFRNIYSEDYDFWLRALILGASHRFNPEVLWTYRRQEGSKTTALVREADSILAILTDAREMPELAPELRSECDRWIEFARARVSRRHLEEALLRGDFRGARAAYVRARVAFPDRAKYLTGLAIMMLSPRVYARIKADRMI
jgi:glycosyltransferase involved in cell wall biosynthesis